MTSAAAPSPRPAMIGHRRQRARRASTAPKAPLVIRPRKFPWWLLVRDRLNHALRGW